MTIADDDGRRNQDGLAGLRRRYVRRASLVSKSREFRQDIDQLRLKWNTKVPWYRVAPVASVDALQRSDAIHEGRIAFTPQRLIDDAVNDRERENDFLDWADMLVGGVCHQYWPSKYFTNASSSSFHPATKFVSACLFCSSYEVGEQADRFFEEFRIAPHSLPYEPDPRDKYEIAKLTGQVDFLIQVIEEHLDVRANDSAIPDLLMESDRAGRHHARRQGVRNWWSKNPSENWWYIPLFRGLSTTDLRSAEGGIVEHMRGVYGEHRLDDMIVEPRDEQLSQQKIADLLGVSQDTVKVALRHQSRREEP